MAATIEPPVLKSVPPPVASRTGKPTPPAATTPAEQAPAAQALDPQVLQLWLKHLVLAFSLLAGCIAFAAARSGSQPLVRAAFYAAAAAVCCGALGTLLSQLLLASGGETPLVAGKIDGALNRP